MRLLPLIVIVLAGSLSASEPASTYPLWDGRESVADYAKRVNLSPTKTLDLGNGVKLELVLIPAGKFMMGTPAPEKPLVGQTMSGLSGGMLLIYAAIGLIRARRSRTRPQFSMGSMLVMTFVAAMGVWGGVRWNDALKHPDYYPTEHPAHAVTLSRPMYMGKYHVTQEQYQAVIGTNPSTYIGKDNPVENVSWDDAQAFCKKVTEQTEANVGLPTEAEWEYACRAGTTTTYNSGDAEGDLDGVAWYCENSKDSTHPVGKKQSNAFGLYDMHGNLYQWCQDWYRDYYYSKSPAENPQGPVHGVFRVLRGGSWHDVPIDCRSADRYRDHPDSRNVFVGFRVLAPAVRNASASATRSTLGTK